MGPKEWDGVGVGVGVGGGLTVHSYWGRGDVGGSGGGMGGGGGGGSVERTQPRVQGKYKYRP